MDFSKIKREFPLVEVANRYIELKRQGSAFVGLCPFHDDHKPSFNIYDSSDGAQKFKCFSCGENGDVIDFISQIEGCSAQEVPHKLNGGGTPATGTRRKIERPKDQSELWEPIVPAPDDAPAYKPESTFNPRRGMVKHYRPARLDTYRDAKGRILCHVVRLEFDDGTKICPTICYCEGPGGRRLWAAKRMSPPFPLMGLDDLAKRPGDAVVLCSGEKCVAALKAKTKRFVPVTWLGGDGTVGKIDFSPLAGRYITYWPDADGPGRRSMLEAANLIEKLGGSHG